MYRAAMAEAGHPDAAVVIDPRVPPTACDMPCPSLTCFAIQGDDRDEWAAFYRADRLLADRFGFAPILACFDCWADLSAFGPCEHSDLAASPGGPT